nr:hypothetical protein [Tanacetum cinerariifolium]
MDPTSSLRRIYLGENVYGSPSEKVEGHRDWNVPEYMDTTGSKEKKVIKALSFYKMETNEVSEWYIAPCFKNGLEAYDGEEDDVEPRIIFGRSFMRLVNGIVNFGSRVITIYLEEDPFKDDYEKTKKRENVYGSPSEKVEGHGDWNAPEYMDTTGSKEKKVIKALSFYKMETDEVSEWYIAPCFKNGLEAYDGGLSLFISKRIRSKIIMRRQKRVWMIGISYLISILMIYHSWMEKNFCRSHLTQEEEMKEALAHKISQKFALLEEVRPVLEIMAYHDKTAERDSDDEEEYEIKRNKFGAPMYGPKPAAYLNCNDPTERSLALQAIINPFRKISVWKKAGCYTNEEEATRQWRTEIKTMGRNDDEAGSSRYKHSRQYEIVEEVSLSQVHHEFLLWEGFNKDADEKAFRGNTRDLGLFEEETDKTMNQHQDSSRVKVSEPGDGFTIYTRRRHTSSSDGVTTSLNGVSSHRLKSDLEDSTS